MAESRAERDETSEETISGIDKRSEGWYALEKRILPRADWRHRLARLAEASAEVTLSVSADENAAIALLLTLSSFADWALKDALSAEGGEPEKTEQEVRVFLARLQVTALSRCMQGGLETTLGKWWWDQIRAWFGGRALRKAPSARLVIGPLCKNCLRPSEEEK